MKTPEQRLAYLEGLIDAVWSLCTDDYNAVTARFGESWLRDDSARLNYMTELVADAIYSRDE